jgi:hypothetical protein
MKLELRKKFQFEAAHLLPLLPEAPKCRRLHGHTSGTGFFAEGQNYLQSALPA